jgi:hypothetical protein
MAAEREVRFGRVGAVEDRRSARDELGEKPRKELVENPRAAEQQSVGVAALGSPRRLTGSLGSTSRSTIVTVR